jgi:hypothetical protein
MRCEADQKHGRMHRRLFLNAWALALVASFTWPLTAPASTTTEKFDDRADGTVLTTQIPGVSFAPGGTVYQPVHETESPPRALRANGPVVCGSAGQATGAQLRMDFSPAIRHAELRTGMDNQYPGELGVTSRLVGYRANNTVARSSGDAGFDSAGPIKTALAIPDGPADIAYAVLYVGCSPAFAGSGPRQAIIDNLSVTNDVSEPPPSATPAPPTVIIDSPTAGQTFSRDVEINISGRVQAPGGADAVCAAANTMTVPSRCDGRVNPDGTFTGLRVSGLRRGQDREGENTITVFARDRYQQLGQASVLVKVDPNFRLENIRVVGMEVTQAIQPEDLLLGPRPGDQARVIDYNGVQLAEDKTTIVRVWANAGNLRPPATSFPGVLPLLRVFRNGRELRPFSPLLPLGGRKNLPLGPTQVSADMRADQRGPFTFWLPPEVTRGRIELRAEVNAVPPFARECPNCVADDKLTLRGVAFRPMRGYLIAPLEIFYTRDGIERRPLADPRRVFDSVRRIYPTELLVPPDYAARLDANSFANVPSDHNTKAFDLVGSWERDNAPAGDAAGISSGLVNGLSQRKFFCCNPPRSKFFVSVEQGLPLSSTAHELIHLVAPHASRACGGGDDGQSGEDWPGDQRGYLQGVGIDTTPIAGQPGVFGLIVPGRSPTANDSNDADPGQYFDVMSYCLAHRQPLGWISPRNWNRLVDTFATGGARDLTQANQRAAASAVRRGPSFFVNAEVYPGRSPEIQSVSRVDAAQDSVTSDFHFVVRNSAGAVLSDTGVPAGVAHTPTQAGIITLQAAVPAGPDAALIEVVQGGTVIARRAASPNLPTVKLLAPVNRATARSNRDLQVTWRAADRDGGQLLSRVEYSSNDGRAWRTLTLGVTGQSARIPGRRLTASRRARIRVTVSDGFNETQAVSPRFVAEGGKPQVSIVLPRAGQALRADTNLVLEGAAFDEVGGLLANNRLRWLDGRRLLGRGRRVSVYGLRPGSRRLRLEARNAQGRVGSQTVSVRVLRVAPTFIAPRIPTRLSRTARSLTVLIAASLASKLTVSGAGVRRRVADVDRRPRRIRVAVTPGRRALKLRFELRSGRARSTLLAEVAR